MDIRAFISVPVTGKIVDAPVLRQLRADKAVRTVPLDNLHITLCFIGDMPEGRVAEVGKVIDDAISGVASGEVRLKGLGAFPKPKDPRVVWVGVDTAVPLPEVAVRIKNGLSGLGIGFDSKPFKPHVTIGRVKGTTDLSAAVDANRDLELTSFRCDSVCLMKSELKPTGARYTVVSRHHLMDE
ncbi:MAG: RNA 2',3'-cyclic phosphodiesterase [Candidatus Methanomethylophilaceae archaeon]|nr:RNA 2',3'-cyclic phosphodiesterase [Candidatus Methanomethylophilaceae archaeon]